MQLIEGETFGLVVRREREAKEFGLREMAKMVGISPTYLSQVERDEFPPPAEDKVKAIAKVLGQNVDRLLALAGRVSSELTDIIKKYPQEAASILRALDELSKANQAELVRLSKAHRAEYRAELARLTQQLEAIQKRLRTRPLNLRK